MKKYYYPAFLVLFSFIPLMIIWYRAHMEISIYTLSLLFGQFGIVLLFWQNILGFRGISTKILGNDLITINNFHKFLGKYGIIFILAHVVILSIERISVLQIFLEIDQLNQYRLYVLVGATALTAMLVVVLTSIFFRKQLKFRPWKRIHLLGYIVLPLSLIHSYQIGPTFFLADPVKFYWYVIGIFYLFSILYRIAYQFGMFKAKYVVESVDQITHDVKSLKLKPKGNKIEPESGQFIYIQGKTGEESHPYTVSNYKENSGEITITIKNLGKYSNRLHNVKKGDIVYLDGPYGVFTQNLDYSTKPIVLIAGGIGITPFMRLINQEKTKQINLFYGNKSEEDIAFKKDIEKIESKNENFKLVHVLNEIDEDSNWKGETGFISVDLMKKYLTKDLTSYTYLICGPLPMMLAIEKQLLDNGVDASEIDYERFSL